MPTQQEISKLLKMKASLWSRRPKSWKRAKQGKRISSKAERRRFVKKCRLVSSKFLHVQFLSKTSSKAGIYFVNVLLKSIHSNKNRTFLQIEEKEDDVDSKGEFEPPEDENKPTTEELEKGNKEQSITLENKTKKVSLKIKNEKKIIFLSLVFCANLSRLLFLTKLWKNNKFLSPYKFLYIFMNQQKKTH